MPKSTVIRPLFGRILSIAVLAIMAFLVITLTTSQSLGTAVRYIWPMLLTGYLAWLAFWQPAVVVSEDGVRLRNIFTTVEIPWASIERIDTVFALTLFTARRKFVAWAAPAPGRHYSMRAYRGDGKNLPASAYVNGQVRAGDLPGTDSGDAATIIRQRWEELNASGQLSETTRESVTLHRWSLLVLGVLVVATVLGIIL